MASIFDDDINSGSIIPTENMLPDRLLLIPLQSRPIFPGIFTPLMINAPEDVKVVDIMSSRSINVRKFISSIKKNFKKFSH